ncbi:hypothetical protein Trydic_g19658 [Trypoxylus dichotomus]
MSKEVSVSQDVKDLIRIILDKEGLSADSEVIYEIGSQIGDGYLSRNIAATIKDGDKVIELFLKCGLNIQSTAFLPIDRYYSNEIHFYDNIYPAYVKFLEEKGVVEGFRNVAKCYGTSLKNILALDNLKKKGYKLCDKTKPAENRHISLVFKTFAKFHAISFAMKDQRKEDYEKLIEPTQIPFENPQNDAVENMFKDNLNEFLATLDPVRDKHLVDGTQGLAESIMEYGKKAFYSPDKTDYDILTQGDCWCNNMMFFCYRNINEKPLDVVLVDWQLIRTCIPIYDLAYFFYNIASEEVMQNLQYYLKLYHDELTYQMEKLGSDPDTLYPFSVFEQHWKQHAKFGYYMGFMLIRMMLSEKEEQLDLEKIDFDNLSEAANVMPKIRNSEEYFRRMKILTEHMVSNGFI